MGWALAELWARYQRWRREQENPLPVPILPGDVAVVETVEGPPGAVLHPQMIKHEAYESVKRREEDGDGDEEEDAG